MCPSDIVVALPRIDQNPFRAAYAAQVVFAGDVVLERHDAFHALLFDHLRDVVRQFACRVGSLLLGIGENPEAFEPYVPYELFQFCEIRFRFTGIADQQRRAQRQVGDRPPQFFDQRIGFGLGVVAVHGRELCVGDVLERDVEVFADLGLGCHGFDHLVGECRGVGVVEAYPPDTVDAAQAAQQFGQAALPVEVEPVVGRVLRNDDQFLHASGREFARLLLQFLHRHGNVPAADERDGAVAAFPVATLRDFQVGIVPGRREVPFGGQGRVFGGSQRPGDAVPCAGAEEPVHFGEFGAQGVGIAFREAADDEQPLDLAGVFRGRRAQDHVDRLLFGVADEPAGVDDYDLGVRAVAVEKDFVACRREPCHQVLAVDRVLRTTERYDVDLFHSVSGFRCKSTK